MRTKAFVSLAAMVGLFISILAVNVSAQDRSRRIQPAFPIGAGEKMIVYAGKEFSTTSNYNSTSWTENTSASIRFVKVTLPVGTTLKRLLGDFVDQSGSANMTISLTRISNSDGATEIVLRTFNTSGISSSSDADYKQVVSNPLSHAMLQGWTYYITIEWPGGTASGDLRAGVVKLVYEP